MSRRSVGKIVPNHLHAYFESMQKRIVKGMNFQPPVFAIDKDIGRTVVRRCSLYKFKTRGHSDDEITLISFQSVSDEAATLRPPGVFHVCLHLARDERGDLILESFLPHVRERKIVRIGAAAQMRAWRGRRGLHRR